jgi:hypothetical protein
MADCGLAWDTGDLVAVVLLREFQHLGKGFAGCTFKRQHGL